MKKENSVFIIAEAGVNHNGSLQQAFKLVDAAVAAKADAVKFQSFKANLLSSRFAELAQYQKKKATKQKNQLEMLQELELGEQEQKKLLTYCKKKKIQFLSTPFESQSLKFLTKTLKLKTMKISSGDLNNFPFLLEVARTGVDIILSTGMGSVLEIHQALVTIAFGYCGSKKRVPTLTDMKKIFRSRKTKLLLKKKVTLLQCVSEYPAPFKELNLNAIGTLRKTFGLNAGYSDHSLGIEASIAACALGASVIEKHFTLNKNLPGPDHSASLEPKELKQMIQAIRHIEVALGDGVKKPRPSEQKNMNVVRKSVVAATAIKKGHVFTEKNLALKRPGTGLRPEFYWKLLGKSAVKNFVFDEPITTVSTQKTK